MRVRSLDRSTHPGHFTTREKQTSTHRYERGNVTTATKSSKTTVNAHSSRLFYRSHNNIKSRIYLDAAILFLNKANFVHCNFKQSRFSSLTMLSGLHSRETYNVQTDRAMAISNHRKWPIKRNILEYEHGN
jgi:hypothetical protein